MPLGLENQSAVPQTSWVSKLRRPWSRPAKVATAPTKSNQSRSPLMRCELCAVKLANFRHVSMVCAACSTQPIRLPYARLNGQAALGVIRLDCDHLPAPGDIDHCDSYGYPVVFRAVPGLSFEMCKSGLMTPEVEQEFIKAITWLDAQEGVSAVTGDCGFMMWFEELARAYTDKPVFMSSLAALPSMTYARGIHGKVAILTASRESFVSMCDQIKQTCGMELHESHYIIVGCEDVPGFESVESKEKADMKMVTAGIISKAKQVASEHDICAFLFECTELSRYANAVRCATGLQVLDTVAASDFFVGKEEGLNCSQEPDDHVDELPMQLSCGLCSATANCALESIRSCRCQPEVEELLEMFSQ